MNMQNIDTASQHPEQQEAGHLSCATTHQPNDKSHQRHDQPSQSITLEIQDGVIS